MKVLHGTWIPNVSDEFMQGGEFCLWVETDEPQQRPAKDRHPQQLGEPELGKFLRNDLGISDPKGLQATNKYFILPSTKTAPLPSLEPGEMATIPAVVVKKGGISQLFGNRIALSWR
jgi:hypothetical protein